ncbi:MAG TPA: type VI secretion system-associated FHA domain protein TagH [Cellvibrionaceae bacterium]
MKITFSLLKAPAKAALQQGQKSFDEQGGSIGRGESNTWALPDPDKFLSSKHCVVTFEQGQFFITDTSTNGLFLNGATLPVGRNNRVSVSEGDTLDLGEYRLRVGLEKSAAKISPFADSSPVEPAPVFNAGAKWGELEVTPQAADGADLFPIGGPGAGGDPFYDASMDPFAAKDPFGLAGDAKPADLFPSAPGAGAQGNPFGADPFGGDLFGGPDPFTPQRPQATPTFTQNEGHNPLHDVISLPKVAPTQAGPAAIPDDFWNSLGGAAAADELGMPSLKPLDPFSSDDPLAPAAPFVPSPPPFTAAPVPSATVRPQILQQPAVPVQHTVPTQHAPPPPQPNLPVHPLDSPSGPDMLGENPFAHISQTPAGPSLAPDDIDGQLYPLGSAYSQQVPSVTSGKVPLSDRLKALQAGAEDVNAPPPWAEPVAPVPIVQAPPIPQPPVVQAPSVAQASPMTQAPQPPYAPPAQPRPPIAAAPAAAPGYAAETGVHNLVAALGLSGQLNGEQEQLLPQLIGEITREAISGLLQILRARNSIKNEFRIAVTTIQPRENNPIKFATDVDDALELLFVRASKGYKPPVESVQDSFESIMDHQVAILAGIRAAFKSLLTRFDPVHLEQQFERQGKTGGLLPGMKGAKCWSAYDDFYQDLIGNFENSFQNLFGDEFVQAYEEQLRKLAIARKREHSQR